MTQAPPRPSKKRDAPLAIPIPTDVLDGCALAWDNILEGRRSADRALTRTLYNLKRISRAERAFIAQTVIDMLRLRSLLDAQQALVRIDPKPRHPVYLYLLGHAGRSPRELAGNDEDLRFIQAALSQWPAHEAKLSYNERLALRSSLPHWLVERLLALYGDQAEPLIAASRAAPPVTLRVNTLKAPDRDALRDRLRRDNDLDPEHAPLSPLALSLPPNTRVLTTDTFKDGWFELQDEGSQLLGLLCDVKPGDKVIDACAGAGGKTLLLAAQMQNKGTLWALDLYEHRLEELKPRARRAGVHNVHIDTVDGQEGKHRLDRLKAAADVVLIDAPCSGTGSLRRNPDGADRLTPEKLAAICAIQADIIDRYSQLVRPGGRLVYATCSVLPEENQDIVSAFLAKHPEFTQLDPRPILASLGASFPQPDHGALHLQTLPHLHSTDGFFAAVFQRNP